MSFPLAPFQVYITSAYYGGGLFTFPCRSAADDYWRRVQEGMYAGGGSRQETDLHRKHPQYFIINNSWDTAPQAQAAKESCIQAPHLRPLAGEMRPDNVNGGRYYIRSVIRPNLFWYFNPDKQIIEISSQFQTKFVIRRKTPLPFQCRPEDDIFIGEDDISIFVATPDWEEADATEVMIVRDSRKLLVAASVLSLSLGDVRIRAGSDNVEDEVARVVNAGVFKFKMFDRGFGVMDNRAWDGKPVYASTNINGGERWEFEI